MLRVAGVEGVGMEPHAAAGIGARPHRVAARAQHRHFGVADGASARVAHLQQVAGAHVALAVVDARAVPEREIRGEVRVVVHDAGGDRRRGLPLPWGNAIVRAVAVAQLRGDGRRGHGRRRGAAAGG